MIYSIVDVDIQTETTEFEAEFAQDVPICIEPEQAYDCPKCGEVFSSQAEVEGHISIEHESTNEKVIKCSECKMALPNDHNAIKHHMITEHILHKQKSVIVDEPDIANEHLEDEPVQAKPR